MTLLFNEVLGREVEVPENPKRIVSFSPAATEVLFGLGLGESVAGVSAFCARPPEARIKRKVGSYNTVRPELLEELAPDLILTVTGYQRGFAIEMSKKFPVYPLELPISVAGIVDFVVKVGLVVGEPDAARAIGSSLLQSLGRTRQSKRQVVYVELDLGGPVTFGAYSYITDALEILGCSGLCGQARAEWLKPDLGRVASLDPDVFIYEPKMYSEFAKEDLEALIAERGWQGLRAVKSGNYFLTPGPLDFLAHHGPTFITEAMPWLSERLSEAENREH